MNLVKELEKYQSKKAKLTTNLVSSLRGYIKSKDAIVEKCDVAIKDIGEARVIAASESAKAEKVLTNL